MAYAPSVYTTTTLATAAAVQANIRAFQEWLDGGMIPGDLKATPAWCERKHLVRPDYIPLVNRLELISGVSAGLTHLPGERLATYVSSSNSDKLAVGDETLTIPVPRTTIDFVLEKAADVRFAFQGFPLVPNEDGATVGQGSAWVEVVLNDGESGETRYASSRSWSFEEIVGSGSDVRCERQPWYCFAVIPNLSAGTHHIGIQGAATVLRAAMFAWTCTLQAYYRHV